MDPWTSRGSGLDPEPDASARLLVARRRILVLAGGLAAYAAVRPHLAWARRLAAAGPNAPPPLLQPWSLPDDPPRDPVDLVRALTGAAVLAPSEWNAQPWRFEAEGRSIRVVTDPRRALPYLDGDQRGLHLSLGAALENLLIAARAWGLQPAATYFPRSAQPGVVAEVTWTPGGPRRDRPLFGVIPERRTNRRGFDGRGIFPQNRAQLIAQIPEMLRLHWLDDRDALGDVADLVSESVREQMLDPRMQREQYAWMRFDDDARRRGDGVPLDALEVSTLSRFMARRYYHPDSWFLRFGADGAAKQARGQVRSAGAVALISAPQKNPATCVAAGQAFERFALKATQLGIAHQALSAPIEVERHRGEVIRRFGAQGEEPLLLVRLGHAGRPDPTPRRSAWVVTSFRTT